MSFVDVFVGNYTIIDFDLYDLWLNGLSETEAAAVLQRQGILQSMGAGVEELVSDTKDNFRLFVNLEKLLKCPSMLSEQNLFQIDADTQRLLIEKYYQFNDRFIREILGKKLSSRNRKDLDDVNEKTRIPLRSCRRQFDNVKRVFKTVEEMSGSLVTNIQTRYVMSDELAKKYATIMFMANQKFETGKRRLNHLTFKDFSVCVQLMISTWSYSAAECKRRDDMDIDLDRLFLQNLRDLKLLTEKEYLDEQKVYMMNVLKTNFTRKKLADVDEQFKNLSKAIINIAYGLNHGKEVRDFFIDVTEKVVEPCLVCGWTVDDVKMFLASYKDAVLRCSLLRSMPQLAPIWERYINTFNQCSARLYHS